MNPTDTNQASELFELCKEVETRTSWEDTTSAYLWVEAHDTYELDNGNPLAFGHPPIPAYTSDYLLERLEDKSPTLTHFHDEKIERRWGANTWTSIETGYADTPLKALLKLTIALSEAGELK